MLNILKGDIKWNVVEKNWHQCCRSVNKCQYRTCIQHIVIYIVLRINCPVCPEPTHLEPRRTQSDGFLMDNPRSTIGTARVPHTSCMSALLHCLIHFQHVATHFSRAVPKHTMNSKHTATYTRCVVVISQLRRAVSVGYNLQQVCQENASSKQTMFVELCCCCLLIILTRCQYSLHIFVDFSLLQSLNLCYYNI